MTFRQAANFQPLDVISVRQETSKGRCRTKGAARRPRYIRSSNFHFRIEPVHPAYIFGYAHYPARQIAPVTDVTKNTNAIPICSFVCLLLGYRIREAVLLKCGLFSQYRMHGRQCHGGQCHRRESPQGICLRATLRFKDGFLSSQRTCS